MAEGSAGLIKLNPDGTVGATIAGKRYTLRKPVVEEIREFRLLWNELRAELEDWIDLDHRPRLDELGNVRKITEPEERRRVRKLLAELDEERNTVTERAWATFARAVFDRLARDPLPDAGPDDPAAGLEPWLVESPAFGQMLFTHWFELPFEKGSGDQSGTAAALRVLENLGRSG